jgi:hypothetical protein
MVTNPILKIDRSRQVPVYTVKKIVADEDMSKYRNRFLKEYDLAVVLTSDADVFTEDGKLLLRFRKNALDRQNIENAYNAMKSFIRQKTKDRGVATGANKGTLTGYKPAVMSNIIGYYDKWSVQQKHKFKISGVKPPSHCRITRFTALYPDKWKRVIPLIEDIDSLYKKLCPTEHASQLAAAKKTAFRISDTAFSTVTTNLNFQTSPHTDSGDWPEGFGNLVVIEKGASYMGAVTAFPQYGVGVDCRTGDFLAMDVHQLHGNTPLIPKDETSQRLSLVSYLREGIVKCGDGKIYDPIKLQTNINNGITRRQKRAQRDQGKSKTIRQPRH